MRCCLRLIGIVGVAVALFAGDPPQRTTRVIRPELRPGTPITSTVISPKTVRETLVAPRAGAPEATAANASPALGIDQAVQRIAAEHALSADLINSVIKVESNYNARAISSKGARGLMQLLPSTALRFGVTDVFNPIDSITGGVRYLEYLLERYGGNYPLALAAYNAGEGAVTRYGGVPPYRETQNYLVEVWKQLQRNRKATEPPKGSRTN